MKILAIELRILFISLRCDKSGIVKQYERKVHNRKEIIIHSALHQNNIWTSS